MSDFDWLGEALKPLSDDLKYAEIMEELGPKLLDVVYAAEALRKIPDPVYGEPVFNVHRVDAELALDLALAELKAAMGEL